VDSLLGIPDVHAHEWEKLIVIIEEIGEANLPTVYLGLFCLGLILVTGMLCISLLHSRPQCILTLCHWCARHRRLPQGPDCQVHTDQVRCSLPNAAVDCSREHSVDLLPAFVRARGRDFGMPSSREYQPLGGTITDAAALI
jgi:hypothetical protein